MKKLFLIIIVLVSFFGCSFGIAQSQNINQTIEEINNIFLEYPNQSSQNGHSVLISYLFKIDNSNLIIVEETTNGEEQRKEYILPFNNILSKGLKTEPGDDLIMIQYDLNYGDAYVSYDLYQDGNYSNGLESFVVIYTGNMPVNSFNQLVTLIGNLNNYILNDNYVYSDKKEPVEEQDNNNYYNYGNENSYYKDQDESNYDYYSNYDYSDYSSDNNNSDDITFEYYDESGLRVYDKSDAYIYRYITYDDEGIMVAYDYKNGKIYRKSQLKNRDESNRNNDILDGYCIWYYDNGDPHFYALYENGQLIKNEFAEIDENGNVTMIFKDDFDNNINNWKLVNNQDVYADIDNGFFVIESKNDYMINKLIYYKIDNSNDFRITSRIKLIEGNNNSGQGILWGFKDWDNYSAFMISSDGYFSIFSYKDGIKIDLSDGWKKSENINQGEEWNKIQINKYSNKIFFSINSKIVDQDEFYPFSGNYLGFVIGSKREIKADYLIIRQMLGNINNSTGGNSYSDRAKTEKQESGNEIKGTGSGILISTDGYIVTNYHVAGDANALKVAFYTNSGRVIYDADFILGDKKNDLAIIKINDTGFEGFNKIPYNFKTGDADIGEKIFALGYPFSASMGAKIVYVEGTISAQSGFGDDDTHYQISAPVQPGNSGGPLFDLNGNLIGIVDSRTEEISGRRAENIAYAIKTYYVQRLIGQMTSYIDLPHNTSLQYKRVTEKVKELKKVVPIIIIY
jgi:S1-C subfamily serine protease